MTTGHAALSFRSVAAPARQWSTEGDNWSLQFAVNMAGGRSRTEARSSLGTQWLLLAPLSNHCVCVKQRLCAPVYVFLCVRYSNRTCLHLHKYVPLNVCGDALVSPHNRHSYYRAKFSPAQRLSSSLKRSVCFLFFFFLLVSYRAEEALNIWKPRPKTLRVSGLLPFYSRLFLATLHSYAEDIAVGTKSSSLTCLVIMLLPEGKKTENRVKLTNWI